MHDIVCVLGYHKSSIFIFMSENFNALNDHN